MKRIILIGGGGHCKSCIDVIEQSNDYSIVGIIDMPNLVGQKILGYEIIGSDEDIIDLQSETDEFLITIGQIGLPKRRKDIYKLLEENDCNIATIISPLAYVSKHATIGKGSIIMHQALINANAEVGTNCIINSKSLIEHDAKVGNHCHIATASTINGNTILGDDSFWGSNAVNKEGASFPKESFIKANSTVK